MQPGSARAAWLMQGMDLKNSWARQHPALPVHKDCCEACEGPSVPSPQCSRISARGFPGCRRQMLCWGWTSSN